MITKYALRFTTALAVILVSICRPGSITATTIVSTNLAQLSETAEKAFVVRIDSVVVGEHNGQPCDVITGLVTDTVFGDVTTSDVITWHQFRFSQRVALPAMPAYQSGKEYLIFLSGPGTGAGLRSPIGLGQGAFLVGRNEATGAATIQNQYRNATLTRGLDITKVAEAMADGNAAARGLSAEARQNELNQRAKQLTVSPYMSLDGIKQAARFFHERKTGGSVPSSDFRTTVPRTLMH